MSFGDFLFGGGTTKNYNNDPRLDSYQDNYANMSYNMGPARKYYKGILKADQQGRAGELDNGMFAHEAANANRDIDADYDPLAFIQGGNQAGNRYQDLRKQRSEQGIFGQKMGFVNQKLDNAAGGLANMFAQKNQWDANKYNTLIGSQGQRTSFQQNNRPGLLGSLAQGAGAVAGAFG